jgi:hypothetical protein
MTLEEAKIVGSIIACADGGCSVCVSELVDQCNEAFPKFKWTMNDDGIMEVKENDMEQKSN